MIETVTLALFCLCLTGCVALGANVVWALAIGLVLFWICGALKGFSARELARMSLSGVKTVKNILVIFLLIGMLTALWRAAGTIPAILCYAADWISPGAFFLLAFLLTAGVSVLTGTAFGTAATMGVILMTMGGTMGLSPALSGGAILSGAFFGDRCSPVSTSAHLVCELTGTDIYENMRGMCGRALVPFALSCAAFALMGLSAGGAGEKLDVWALFGSRFAVNAFALAPAAVILLLSAFRVNVRVAMLASILAAAIVCAAVQRVPLSDLPGLLVFGYRADDPALAPMLDGGGVLSMLRVSAIILISSSYSGIFRETGMLGGAERLIARLSHRITPFGAVAATSVFTGMVACNQTLAVMLTHQLCGKLEPDSQSLALDLEDSAIVVSPLIPWSIACAVPLSSISAPTASIAFACYLYLLPLWRLLVSLARRKSRAPSQHP